MRQKGWQVFLGFVVVFYLVVLIQDMPNLVNGHAAYEYLPTGIRSLLKRLTDIALCSMFALSAYFAMLKFYPRRMPATFATIVICFVPLLLVIYLLSGPGIRLRFFFLSNIFYYLLYTAYGIVFFLVQYASFREVQANELTAKQKDSELSFLRSQINPHFLFNSLNNIYSLVYERSDKALDAIAGFSDLMRYMLYNTDQFIAPEQEIDYIKKYIALQQLRYDGKANIGIVVTGGRTKVRLAPLLLIPFVENAFKHGLLTDQQKPVAIAIVMEEHSLHFSSTNWKSDVMKDQQGGIGIENVKKRLQLLFPAHKLDIISDEAHYTVNLRITND